MNIKWKDICLYVIIIITVVIIIYTYVPNRDTDTAFEVSTKQWSLRDHGINISELWKIEEKSKSHESEVVIAIIDSGIDVENDLISDSILVNKNEIPDNGIDDDKNGYIDDIYGWNFYDNNNQVYVDHLTDYHGTMIAGIIAANHNNSKYWGVFPNAKILPVKTFAGTEADLEDVAEAINYSIDRGADIINLSWTTIINNKEIRELLKNNSDVLFIVAVGDEIKNLDNENVYPASYDLPNIISVAALDVDEQLYEYSNFGSKVTAGAPGKDINVIFENNETMVVDGSSIATANVTGSLGLIKSLLPNVEASDYKKIIKELSYNSEKSLNIIDSYQIYESLKESN